MVLGLARALDIPLRDRNVLLDAAGFAPIYRETALDAPMLEPVRDAIQLMLAAMEPNPTFVINRRYDVLDANKSGKRLLAAFTRDLSHFTKPLNMGRMLVSQKGIRPYVKNWDDVAGKVLGRLKRDIGGAHIRDSIDDALLKEVEPVLVVLQKQV